MGVQTTCPACGMDSAEVRCPRCNALKVVGCSGSCALCGGDTKQHGCTVEMPLTASKPSDLAPEDACHPGTPLER